MKVGDKVSVLDDAISGEVLKINRDVVVVRTEDDFDMEFNTKELVVIDRSISEKDLNMGDMSAIIKEKEAQKRHSTKRVKPNERSLPPMEVDLHIHQLVKYTKGMSNYDMLNLQVDTAKRQLDFAIGKRIQKVVFIHGVGAGVLRAELEFLFNRYDHLKFYDANFQKYGRGAIEVYIFQNKQA